MKVEVRPLPLHKWHEKEGKDSFASPIVIEALFDTQTQRYATGLSEEDRKRLEEATGQDLSDKFDFDKPHPFWSSTAGQVKLPNNTVIFDTSKPLDEIKVKILKASKFVANSMKDYQDGLYPEATHVIYDEAEEVELKARKIEVRNKALAISLKMSPEDKVNIIQILSDRSVRNMSPNFINVELDKIINDNPVEFLKWAKMDKAQVYVRAQILEAIHRNILTKEGSGVFYMGDQIGYDIDDAVNYFTDPQNSKLKAIILEKLNG